MEQITLEDHLLKGMLKLTKKNMNSLIENLEIELSEKFNRSQQGFEAIEEAVKIIARYGSIYSSMRTKFDKVRFKNSKKEDEFLRAYWSYIASEGSLSFLKNGTDNSVICSTLERTPVSFNLDLNSTDQSTLTDALTHLSKYLLTSSSPDYIKKNAIKYFQFLRDYSIDKMNLPTLASFKEKYKDTAVIGKNFKIKGIKEKKSTNLNQPNSVINQDNNLKGLEDLAVDPVKRNEIVGNEKGIDLIETDISCLLHYNHKEKRNTFNGFNQYILLAGGRGTGKTMLARYGITLAKDIANKTGKPLSIVGLDFEDKFQCGPLLNIKKQLKEISEGNRIYIVFLDEVDTKIPSRSGAGREGHKRDTVGEVLKFRGGGEYPNYGNFILLATTNEPNNIDPAILNVFKLEEIPGPLTKEEKVQVLYNNLKKGIDQGYVKLTTDGWKTIGTLLTDFSMTGRDIVNIARWAKKKYRTLAKVIPQNLPESDKSKMIYSILSKNGSEYVTKDEDIYQSIEQITQQKLNEEKSYLVKK